MIQRHRLSFLQGDPIFVWKIMEIGASIHRITFDPHLFWKYRCLLRINAAQTHIYRQAHAVH
jgi:hypothetical protein